MMETGDRRLFERVKVGLPVKFKDSDTQVEGETSCCDISGGGIRLSGVVQNIKPLEELTLWLELGDGKESIPFSARVVWTKLRTFNTLEMGLEFDQVKLFDLWRVFNEERGSADAW